MAQTTRRPLTRDRVLQAALELADAGGFESLTMRRLATQLRVEAMSLYNHVANKEDIVDGLVDLVFGEFEVAAPGELEWKVAMRRRALSIRAALNRHRWAVGLMEGRMNPGPNNVRYHDAVMGCLREAGFPFRAAVHAYSVQDAYIYGFALQEKNLGFETPEESAAKIDAQRTQVPAMDDHPYLMEVAEQLQVAGYDYAAEFEWGLDLILDALERYREAALQQGAGVRSAP